MHVSLQGQTAYMRLSRVQSFGNQTPSNLRSANNIGSKKFTTPSFSQLSRYKSMHYLPTSRYSLTSHHSKMSSLLTFPDQASSPCCLTRGLPFKIHSFLVHNHHTLLNKTNKHRIVALMTTKDFSMHFIM
jgi:hypothetical protein